MRAKLLVPSGGFDQESDGEMSSPSHVYRLGIFSLLRERRRGECERHG